MSGKKVGSDFYVAHFSVRPSYVALLAIVALAAILRCQHIAVLSFDYDEAYTWKMTTFPVGEIAPRLAQDLPPPLYFYAVWAWSRVFGDSPAALRSFSVLFGLATVVSAYLLVRQMGSGIRENSGATPELSRVPLRASAELPALAAAALVALSPLQVDFSQRARMYSLGAALTVISCWLLLRALGAARPRWRDFVAYSLAAAALAYTHSAGLLVIAAQFLYAVGWAMQARAADDSLSRGTKGGGAGEDNPKSKIENLKSRLLPVAFAFALTVLL